MNPPRSVHVGRSQIPAWTRQTHGVSVGPGRRRRANSPPTRAGGCRHPGQATVWTPGPLVDVDTKPGPYGHRAGWATVIRCCLLSPWAHTVLQGWSLSGRIPSYPTLLGVSANGGPPEEALPPPDLLDSPPGVKSSPRQPLTLATVKGAREGKTQPGTVQAGPSNGSEFPSTPDSSWTKALRAAFPAGLAKGTRGLRLPCCQDRSDRRRQGQETDL